MLHIARTTGKGVQALSKSWHLQHTQSNTKDREPKLDLDRLSEVRAKVDIPLVLHGTSGVPEEQVRDCIRRGICKVNYATDLRIAFTAGVKKAIAEQPDAFDPKKYLAEGRKAVQARVQELIRLLGSSGKA